MSKKRRAPRPRRVTDTEVLKERTREHLNYLDDHDPGTAVWVGFEAMTDAIRDHVAFAEEVQDQEWCDDAPARVPPQRRS